MGTIGSDCTPDRRLFDVRRVGNTRSSLALLLPRRLDGSSLAAASVDIRLAVRSGPGMLPLNLKLAIQQRMIPRHRHHGNSAPAISAPTAEIIVVVFVQVMVDQHQQRIGVVWQDFYSNIKQVIQVQLTREGVVLRRSSANANGFRTRLEADARLSMRLWLLLAGWFVPHVEAKARRLQQFHLQAVIEGLKIPKYIFSSGRCHAAIHAVRLRPWNYERSLFVDAWRRNDIDRPSLVRHTVAILLASPRK